MRVMFENDALIDKILAERRSIINSRVKLVKRGAIVDAEELPEPWYVGPGARDTYWPALKSHLEADEAWHAAVPSLDASSDSILTMLADPNSERIQTRGLVVGYVQSGKTASFTATIAKAADAGYRMFIVLSGVHNSLRSQTQIRLDEQLTDLNPAKWLSLTSEHQDFGNPVKALPLVAGSKLRLLAVVKKNVSRLERLREWLETAHAQGGLENCPVLIIDDEADQASVNTHKDPDLDRTRINEELVALLALPRVAYLGYTATPFANVLANPADASDIYPRTFIISLPKPAGYFGAEELFALGKSEDELTSDEQPPDVIRFVGPTEIPFYQVRRNQAFIPVVTDSLQDAVRWFVIATAARRLRSGETKHSSMLVHTTVRIQPQLDYVTALGDYIKTLKFEVDSDNLEKWKAQWSSETLRESGSKYGYAAIQFEDLVPEIRKTLKALTVVADNSESDDRLIYGKEPETVIAVGGNTLSRGLTLHGLISSYFLRTASTYDSVLQMGRWFGYRPGYEDLPRVWTTKDLAEDFRFLSEVERDLRKEIDRYSGGLMTPRDLAVRILLHPRMNVTSRLKMSFAVSASASYSEHRPQTTYFAHRDVKVAKNNLSAVLTLVSEVSPESFSIQPSFITARDVGYEPVLSFIKKYNFHSSSEMSDGSAVRYVEQQLENGSLERWDIAIVTRQSSTRSVPLGFASEVNAISRSQLLVSSDPETANIGTLMSRQDRLVGLENYKLTVDNSDREIQNARNQLGRALLLVYPIEKTSAPREGAELRTSLSAIEDQIGLAIVFPIAAEGSEESDRIQVNLRMATEAELDESVDEAPYVDDEGSHNEVDLDA